MNAHASVHEIPGVPNLYVDAFRGRYLAEVAARRPAAALVLTHYHGDHYGALPRDGAYRGPARIHCTPPTARLLRDVHGVPPHLVVPHAYGVAWTVPAVEAETAANDVGSDNPILASAATDSAARVTFYDAHHCPGAAILVIEATADATGRRAVHVHTGDFRYCRAMRNYPLLREAALARRVERLFLDTTYAHPRHDFPAQAAAVAAVAGQVRDALAGGGGGSDDGLDGSEGSDTLVLLECYQLGKEKVLRAVADACRRPLYVTDRKWRLLQCLAESDAAEEPTGGGRDDDESDKASDNDDRHHRLMEVCTRDAAATNLHVVPMGTTARMWPFFQPDYDSVAAYLARQSPKTYRRAVAVVPTGWAGASAWNRRHAATRVVRHGLTIEIRLMAYSEHSSFQELSEFVDFVRPMQVVPTVYRDDKDKRQIEARFPVDQSRAKKRFLDQLVPVGGMDLPAARDRTTACITIDPSASSPAKSDTPKRMRVLIEVQDEVKMSQLMSMGFVAADAHRALAVCRQDVEAAVHHLLQPGNQAGSRTQTTTPGSQMSSKLSSPKPRSVIKAAPTKLTAFFCRKPKT